VISNITVDNITVGGANFNAATNENTTCFVEYGLTENYTKETANLVYGLVHQKLLYATLDPGTVYHYRWNCTDPALNSGVSGDHMFVTSNQQSAPLTNGTETNVTFNMTDNGTSTAAVYINIFANDTVSGTVTVTQLFNNPTGSNLTVTGYGIYYNITSDEFNSTNMEWIEIRLYYNDSELPAGVDEETMRLYWFNGATWEAISPGGVNVDENYVWGRTNHFSYYSLGGSSAESPGGGSARKVTFDPNAETGKEEQTEPPAEGTTQPSQEQPTGAAITSTTEAPMNVVVITAAILIGLAAIGYYFIKASKKTKRK
jgi:hypothetical protein